MKKEILDLIELSKYSARHPDFVQGGGGNCSVKFAGEMAIKASGFFLEDVNLDKGYVLINLKTNELTTKTDLKPSLETPIHCLLGNYVIHTHPILAGAMVCAKQGKKIFKDVFNESNYFWVKYSNPGVQLSKSVSNLIFSENIDINKEFALFLENHGIFVSTPSKESCIDHHENLIKKLDSFFKYKECNFNESTKVLPQNEYLTPDHAVYYNLDKNNLSEKSKVAVNEVRIFIERASSLIKSNQMEIQYLSKNDVKFILNMEEEKYRQKI